MEIETKIGKEILKLENKVIEKNGTGVFLQRLNNDTGTLSFIFNILISNIANIIMDIGIFVVVFIINKIAFIFLIVSLLILFILEKVRSNECTEKDKVFRTKAENLWISK